MLVWMTMLATAGLAMAGPAAAGPATPRPDWITPPTAVDAMKYYPPEAQKQGVAGSAVIECTLRVTGELQNCQLARETPAGWGFGEAALAMAPDLRARPYSTNGIPYEGQLKTPITFRMPETPEIAPVSLTVAGQTGAATLDCRVAAEARFDNCVAASADTPALGEAALTAAANLRAPPALAAGTRVTIPLVFAPAS